MEESVLVNKAENYLKEIANDSIVIDDIDEFDNFKNLYFKLVDRLNYLQNLKDDMDAQGYTTPFTSLSRYGTKSVADVSLEEVGENSRHNQIFRMKANSKKNAIPVIRNIPLMNTDNGKQNAVAGHRALHSKSIRKPHSDWK